MIEITGFVVRQGLRELKTSGLGDDGRFLAINISTHDLANDDLVAFLRDQLRELDLPGSCLHLEVTETSAMADPDRARRVLDAIAELGITIVVDDYGTGHSSLSYLQKLPVSTLKIDRTFVSGMTKNSSDLAIVRSTIDLAHNLGLLTIAEGVEDSNTMRLLGQLGCDAMQGFLFGRPGPIGTLETNEIIDLRAVENA